MATLPVAAAALLACASPAEAQVAPTKRYLMAFHACEGTLCRDPRNHSVYLAESNDGAAWTMVPGWAPIEGSVPDVIQRGRTLYIYTANSMVARYNLDTGESNRVGVRVTGLPSGSSTDWADPSLHVDEDGRLVLFVLYAPMGGGDPARCPTGVASCTKLFLSATEVDGSDGTEFAADPGRRAEITIPTSTATTAADPDVFFDGTQYVMYISHGSSTSVWTSPALRGSYTQSTALPSGLLSNMRGGVPSGHFDPTTSRYWTYTHFGQNSVSVIRRAVHANLSQQLGDTAWTSVVTGAGVGLGAAISVESPGFAELNLAAGATTARTWPCGILPTPGPLTSAVVGGTVSLVWGGVGAASSYLLEVERSESDDVMTRDTGTAATEIVVRNVPPGAYAVRIRARSECGLSPASDDVPVIVR